MSQELHIGAFVNFNLCRGPEADLLSGVYGVHLQGQYREVMAREYALTCDHCKLLLNVMHGNGLTPLFNSDQALLAQKLKAILK